MLGHVTTRASDVAVKSLTATARVEVLATANSEVVAVSTTATDRTIVGRETATASVRAVVSKTETLGAETLSETASAVDVVSAADVLSGGVNPIATVSDSERVVVSAADTGPGNGANAASEVAVVSETETNETREDAARSEVAEDSAAETGPGHVADALSEVAVTSATERFRVGRRTLAVSDVALVSETLI